MNWRDHSSLFLNEGHGKVCIAKGELHALVKVAMTVAQGLDNIVIETDGGQMFCQREIARIDLLPGRPD